MNTEIIQTGVGLVNKDVKFTYNATGLNTGVERYVDGLLKVKTAHAYDAFGRLTGIEQRNGAGVVISNSVYELDIQDRLKTETKDGQGRNIGYDNIDQVTTVSGSNRVAAVGWANAHGSNFMRSKSFKSILFDIYTRSNINSDSTNFLNLQ